METATAARIIAGYPGIGKKTGSLPEAKANAVSMGLAEKCLEGSFLPNRDTLVSFLVNALYLFGDQGIAAYGGLPEGVEAELSRLGHKVAHGGGRDRALFLAQAFGRGGDDEIMETLRAMRKTVRPGGLVCFHVFDRDRAWSLVGERSLKVDDGTAKVRLGFQPETGRITARVENAVGPAARSVKAWNLGEIRILLRSAGMQLERAYGDWDGGSPEAAGAATGRLIIVAARPRAAGNRIARIRAARGAGRKASAT